MNENIEEELVQCKKIKVNKVIQNIFMVSPRILPKISTFSLFSSLVNFSFSKNNQKSFFSS